MSHVTTLGKQQESQVAAARTKKLKSSQKFSKVLKSSQNISKFLKSVQKSVGGGGGRGG